MGRSDIYTGIPPNLTLTPPEEKKLKITNYRRFAITRDIQGKIQYFFCNIYETYQT